MSVAALRKLCGPDMRTLRAIADERRYGEIAIATDREVRRENGQPSIYSLVLQRRRKYYLRIPRRKPVA